MTYGSDAYANPSVVSSAVDTAGYAAYPLFRQFSNYLIGGFAMREMGPRSVERGTADGAV